MSRMALEKKARDVITYEGERYFIEDRDTGCDDCAFRRSECHVPVLECRADYREDGRAVKFIKI